MQYGPWIGNLVVRGTPANYGTIKLFIDEDPPSSPISLTVHVEIASGALPPEAFEVEVFTNLDRRDFVKAHEPLSDAGNPASSYWLSHRMEHAGRSWNNFVYEKTIQVSKCGAYRLTARYRRAGSSDWWWHNDFAPAPGHTRQRDCSVVISPRKATGLRLYEANALTVEAVQGGSYENRSTLDDFLPTHDFDGFNPFQLDYVRETLGFNALWLMPIFPNTRWRWNTQTWSWAGNDDPGSPYATRDYWSINPWLADDGRSERAMELFLELVDKALDTGLDVFIDTAFNHAGRDVIYGNGAVELGLCTVAERDSWIREVRAAWCTRGSEFRSGESFPHYRERASNGFECAIWAPADRLNEHVWDDANVDWYFGDYSSLGPKGWGARDYWGNPVRHHDERGSAEDERDIFYTDLGSDREAVRLWTYFGNILPYWLRKTNGKLAGIRADFAQGLPNQLWEFIINTARKERWDFVFLAEVLDPDAIQYRLNKVFDVLTTKDHYLYRTSDLSVGQLRASLEGEAHLFGSEALLMHNGTSHDEQGNPDKWAMMARYGVAAAAYGVPMVFMGQPLGLADKLPFRQSWGDMYLAWTRDDPDRAQVADMYRRINAARDQAPELRSPLRYFLNLNGGGLHDQIFSVARWCEAGDVDSVVFIFINLSTTSAGEAGFEVPRIIRLAGTYQVRNLVASDSDTPVWSAARTADEIYSQGVYVQFSYPNEIQYLALVSLAE